MIKNALLIKGMEEPNTQEETTIESQDKEDKKAVGELFGVQLSAPQGMKNPLGVFLLLVVGNFLLLFGIGKALGLF